MNLLNGIFPPRNNIYSAIYPLHLFTNCVGLACYRQTCDNGNVRYAVKRSSVGGCVLATLAIALFTTAEISTNKKSMADKGAMVKFIYLQNGISGIISVVVLVVNMIYAPNVMLGFRNIEVVDRVLRKIGIQVDYRKTYRHAICTICVCVVAVILLVIKWVYTYPGVERLILSIFGNFSYLINTLVEVQLAHYMEALAIRFEVANSVMQEMSRFLDSDDAETYDEYRPFRNSIFSVGKNKVKLCSTRQALVDTTATIHAKLCDTVALLNRAFCIQLLISITAYFIGIVSALFLMAKYQDNPEADNVLLFALRACTNALKLILLVYITNRMIHESSQWPKLLHRLQNLATSNCLDEAIEIYSLQMHQNRLQFFVCGLFPLDYTLLNAIVAGATTYLIILLQFNDSSVLT